MPAPPPIQLESMKAASRAALHEGAVVFSMEGHAGVKRESSTGDAYGVCGFSMPGDV